MKVLILFFCIFFSYIGRGQTVVLNDKLLYQITKNQTIRSASEKKFLDSYEKQKKMYDDINKKIIQVVAIQEYIYKNLYEVNQTILQGKRLYYIYKDLEQLVKQTRKMATISTKKPQYAILVTHYYKELYDNALKLKTELTQEILNENNDFLMDSYDRDKILYTISWRVNNLKNIAYYITFVLETADKTPYIYQIPVIKDYINTDRIIIRGILEQYKILKY